MGTMHGGACGWPCVSRTRFVSRSRVVSGHSLMFVLGLPLFLSFPLVASSSRPAVTPACYPARSLSPSPSAGHMSSLSCETLYRRPATVCPLPGASRSPLNPRGPSCSALHASRGLTQFRAEAISLSPAEGNQTHPARARRSCRSALAPCGEIVNRMMSGILCHPSTLVTIVSRTLPRGSCDYLRGS